MIPLTHFVYVGCALVCIGLCGGLIRRDLIGLVLSLQLAAWGCVLIAATWSTWWGSIEGHALAALLAVAAPLQGALLLSTGVRALWDRAPGADDDRSAAMRGDVELLARLRE